MILYYCDASFPGASSAGIPSVEIAPYIATTKHKSAKLSIYFDIILLRRIVSPASFWILGALGVVDIALTNKTQRNISATKGGVIARWPPHKVSNIGNRLVGVCVCVRVWGGGSRFRIRAQLGRDHGLEPFVGKIKIRAQKRKTLILPVTVRL